MENDTLPETETPLPVGNPPIYFEPQPAWPKGGMARIITAPKGGVAVYTDAFMQGVGPEPEAFFSTPADLILYMLAQFGEDTAREVYVVMEGLYGPSFDEMKTMVESIEELSRETVAPGAGDNAETTLASRIVEAVDLLRSTGWNVTPDLSPKESLFGTGSAILSGPSAALVQDRLGITQQSAVAAQGAGGAGGPAYEPDYRAPADNTIYVAAEPTVTAEG